MIESFSDLLGRWTAKELAEALGVNYQTAASMKRRGAVGVHHWARLIDAARASGVAIDEATLHRLWRERRAGPARVPSEAAD